MTIAPLDASFAEILNQPRSAFVEPVANGVRIQQTGGAYIGDRLAVPTTPFEMTDGEPAIETFVCGPNEPVAAMGDDERLIELWHAFAQQMADAVYEAASEFNISLEGPGYLTASALPLPLVSHDPHFDDDLFVPTDGASIVATVATHGGTRCTTDPIELPAPAVGAPLAVPPETKDWFDGGPHARSEAEQGRLMILPQFAQLHSGPDLESGDANTLRTLYVFRCRTTGAQPTARRRRQRS